MPRKVDSLPGLFDAAEVAEKCIHSGLFSNDEGLDVLRFCVVCRTHVPNREL